MSYVIYPIIYIYTLFSNQGPRNITSNKADPFKTDITTQKPHIFDMDLEEQKKADYKGQGKL